MIKLFRNIRKKLVSENRSIIRNTNYLKYALGEIVLVVIGILIALQVNNWNEQRKDQSLEQNYLKRLIVDLTKDRETLQFSNDLCDIRMEQINKLTAAINHPDSLCAGYNQLVESIEKVTWKSYLPLSQIVYNELQTTGRMALLQKEALREELANYYAVALNWEKILQSLEFQKEFSHATAGILEKEMLAAIEASEPIEMKKAENHTILNIDNSKAQQMIRDIANYSNATRWLPQIYHYHALSKEVIDLLLSKNEHLINTIQNETTMQN